MTFKQEVVRVWSIYKASFPFVRKHPKLLIFPVLSVCFFLLLFSIPLLCWLLGTHEDVIVTCGVLSFFILFFPVVLGMGYARRALCYCIASLFRGEPCSIMQAFRHVVRRRELSLFLADTHFAFLLIKEERPVIRGTLAYYHSFRPLLYQMLTFQNLSVQDSATWAWRKARSLSKAIVPLRGFYFFNTAPTLLILIPLLLGIILMAYGFLVPGILFFLILSFFLCFFLFPIEVCESVYFTDLYAHLNGRSTEIFSFEE